MSAAPRGRSAEVAAGDVLPEIRLRLDYSRVAGQVAGTRDFMPYHHDPDAARAQGQPTIYVNTMFLEAFLDRLAIEWAGPGWFLARRSMQILASAHAGQTLVGSGQIQNVTTGTDGQSSVELAVQATTESGLCAQARITLRQWPTAGGREPSSTGGVQQ